MTRKLIIASALAALSWAANAQITSHELGYCEGEVKTSSTDGFSLPGVDDYISAAVFIPAAQAKAYAECEIAQINAGLASTLKIDNLTVWVRTDLQGENLAEGAVSKTTDPAMAKGWNNVTLTSPYVIPADSEGFYIGLTYHQTSTSVGLSILQNLPVAEGTLFVQLGSEAEWADRSAEGVLAIEGIVSGEKLPQINLSIKGCELQQNVSLANGKIAGSLTIRNNAGTTVSGFDIICTLDGDDTQVYTCPVSMNIAYKETATVPFSFVLEGLTADEPITHILDITVDNIAEGADTYMDDNKTSGEFKVVALYYDRNVLMEEFTTEMCSNCPRIAGWLHSVLGKDGMDERVNVLCHHAGYMTDWLTIAADKTYLWLYGTAPVSAPALLVDRVTGEGYSTQDPKSPIFFPYAEDDIYNILTKRMADPAYVYLDVDVELTDGNAHVTVTGERAIEEFTVNKPRIVVALVEDNIPAKAQIGADGPYIQQHVNRVYNATWGETLDFDGDTYSYECDLPVDASYVKENLSVVAYIWDYDPVHADKCEISNSNRCRYADMTDNTSGIDSVAIDTNGQVQYFNLQGLRVNALQKGLNIIRNADGTVSKVIIKD